MICHYYDSCALEDDIIQREIINSKNSFEMVTSHLALGEAIANIKFHKNDEAASLVARLLMTLSKERKIKFLGHDDIGKVLEKVRETFPRLAISDSIHLATAIQNQCSIFVTADRDFNVNKQDLRELAKEYGIPDIGIRRL